ncbi:hypothetical protein Syun_002554 [Stephania yunnanensis]|uniref:Uncharacterized protein n=1 Tax=Stephania yunnanensis TaxID=152371 RepID=A0AAP0LJX1_9MAGN
MAGSTRFELSASSPEGSAFNSSYTNVPRGNYSGANLERSGSFREGVESRNANSGQGLGKVSASSLMEMPLPQFLALEPITMGDQKFTRTGEARRVLGFTLGSGSEDHSFGVAHLKASPLIASEELKRLKASVLDTSNKARDRAKKLVESISKLDKYRHTVLSRKRSNERSGGANMLKMGIQLHQNPPDLVPQRLEDRTKHLVLNKRARSSIVDSEGRNSVISRQPAIMDKDMVRAGSGGGSVQVEEKIRGLPAAGEGWDKKMKRKRSVGTMVARAMDGDRELKRAMHPKLGSDPRPRSSEAQGFGPNVREDGQAGSPNPITKGKASRAPRTGSSVLNSSPHFSRTSGTLDGWEQSSTVSKVQSTGGPNNRKRPVPTGSSSPPVAQWVGQRPQKISRTRRANLVSHMSNHDDSHMSSEGFPAPDVGARISSSETSGPLMLRGASNNTQQFKMKLEHVPSPVGLSESEESGAGEIRLKEKGTDNDEIVDKSISAVEKVSSFLLPSKKNHKLSAKEEIGDGVRRQGRSGRGSSLSRSCIIPAKEKFENPGISRALQSTRAGPDKSESKSGRPPSKKQSDRKASNRSGHLLNSCSSDMTGESDDDREELLAAANSVHNARFAAYSGPFWKKLQPLFVSISAEQNAYLKQQVLNLAKELDENLWHFFSADHDALGEVVQKEAASSQSFELIKKQQIKLNGVGLEESAQKLGLVDQLSEIDVSSEKLYDEKKLDVIPLYQRILSALIGDDEAVERNRKVDCKNAPFQGASDSPVSGALINLDAELPQGDNVGSEVESEVEFRPRKYHLVDTFSCDGSVASNSLKSSSMPSPLCSDELWTGDESLVHSDGVVSGFSQNSLDGPQSLRTSNACVPSIEYQYEHMCMEDRLLMELQSIGIYPEVVPDLAEGEEINKNIAACKMGLFEQVGKKRKQLSRIDKEVQEDGGKKLRNHEQSAMDSLVEMSYRKRMACRGNNASKSGFGKISKKAALAFVKRTVARCQKFEDTGASCFSEPGLQDALSATPYTESRFNDGVCGKVMAEVHNNQVESGTSAVGNKFDGVSSDAFQAFSHSPDPAFVRHDPLSNRGKKKEVLLDDVAGSAASRASSGLGSTLVGGAKGRRSERDRDQNKHMSTRNSVAKVGRPALGTRGERKTKTKPKQKIAQLSTSGTGLLGRIQESTPVYPELHGSNGKMNDAIIKVNRENNSLLSGNTPQDSSKETEETADFTNLQLHDIDSIEDLGAGNLAAHQDLSSWLNFDEDGLQDHDSMGLEIPMDDLSELNMIMTPIELAGGMLRVLRIRNASSDCHTGVIVFEVFIQLSGSDIHSNLCHRQQRSLRTKKAVQVDVCLKGFRTRVEAWSSPLFLLSSKIAA